MSKHWKPGKKTVELSLEPRPSRIRRNPVPVQVLAERKVKPVSSEREIWLGMTGVVLFAIALAMVTVGIATTIYSSSTEEAAAHHGQFDHCYNASGPNCVLDGGTIYVAGEKVAIAGIEAPQIDSAACPKERDRGIDAAVRLLNLLNRGHVTVSRPFRELGREVRKVDVGGRDVGEAMIGYGAAREVGTGQSWC